MYILRKCSIALTATLLLLSGCTSVSTKDISAPTDEVYTIGYEKTEPLEKFSGFIEDKVFPYYNRIPIQKDGKLYGYLKINFIEKLGIYDWSCKEAVQNSIKHSYSLNYSLYLLDSSKDLLGNTVKGEVFLEDNKGGIIGLPCNVGWSGFNTQVGVFTEEQVSTIETGVQPINNKKVSKIRIDISTEDKTFDSIYVGASLLNKVKKGPYLLNNGDSVTITYINGASVIIKPTLISIEEHGTDSNRSDLTYCDIEYSVKYVNAPTNERKVSVFDSNSKDHTFNANFLVGVSLLGSSVRNYESDKFSKRRLFSDSKKEYYYVTDNTSVSPGESHNVITNRALDTGYDGKYVRLVFEFPEETKVTTEQEAVKFNGRFVVFQLKVSERVLSPEKEGK